MRDPDPAQEKLSTRRGFLAGGAMLGGAALVERDALAAPEGQGAVLASDRPDTPYPLASAENIIYTACLQCNTGCGVKCKVEDGTVTKVDGNPYSPWTLLPHIPYAADLSDAALVDGGICPKGHAGVQIAYDPYRLRKVLKRAGKRGENKWKTIPFAQAVKEICDGGNLFADVPGESTRAVEGLRSIMALTDGAVMKAMEADIKAYWDEKDKTKKAALTAKFRENHAAHMGAMIDPEHPDFGPKNNQIVVNWGRLKDGRGDFWKRFAAAMGTVNAHGHTTVCQGSLYFTCKAISEQYEGGKFTNGQKFYWQADTENSKFILFVGANLYEANYGPPNRAVRLSANVAEGRTKIVCVDPRFSKLASKSWKWLPINPGADGALAMAFIRFMLDEKKFDAKFLASANKAGAKAAGEDSWTNSTWLVVVKDGKAGKHLRATDAKLREPEKRKTPEGKDFDEKFMVAMVGGVLTVVDPNDDKTPVVGDLFVDAVLPDGTVVKSGLQILAETARAKTIAEWCAISGIREEDMLEVAREMVKHGKKAVVDMHRGPAQHTNGFWNILGWMTVNMLLGNFDAKGGSIKPTTSDYAGKGKWFDLKAHPGKPAAFGLSSIRHGIDYEKTSVFAGYPAKRNWYPLASDIYEEVLPSMGDAYPYGAKAYFLYMGAPTYALPAGHTNIEILQDTTKVPLYVASDILIGTTSMYADYIFPDLTYLERWEFQGTHPNIPQKVQPIRQPAIAPIPETCTVFGQEYPISMEALVLGIAEELKLPGFGPDGFGKGLALQHPDDLYLRGVGNLAHGEKPEFADAVPDANAAEIEVFLAARSHLPKCVFDAARWKAAVGDKLWPKVVYVLNRGGRFEEHGKSWKGERHANAYAKLLNLYQEKTASTIAAGTGKHLHGTAQYVPIQDYHGNEPTKLREGYDLVLVTHRTISQTKSRTIASPWLSALMPDNGILVSLEDAARLGLRDGQQVKVVSATNTRGVWPLGPAGDRPMVGKVVVTRTVRPGVVSFALGFGHWATGACDVTIDGTVIAGEPRRAAGLHANAAMWTDPTLPNTCMFDPVGGSVSFYDTHIRLEPVS